MLICGPENLEEDVLVNGVAVLKEDVDFVLA